MWELVVRDRADWRTRTGIITDLSRDQDDELTAQFYKVAKYWKSPDEGSSTTLVAALDPALNGR